MTKRSKATKKAQAAYERSKLDAGEHIQAAVKLKTPADVALFRALERRFPELGRAGIVKLALRELAAKANKR